MPYAGGLEKATLHGDNEILPPVFYETSLELELCAGTFLSTEHKIAFNFFYQFTFLRVS